MPTGHVIPRVSQWVARIDQTDLSTHWTQDAAWDAARDYLQDHGGGELNIHGTDGRIRAKDTIYPGRDPRNVRG